MSLPLVGESLDPGSTLETKARRTMRGGDYAQTCSRCKRSPYPRGYAVNLGLCWTCAIPSYPITVRFSFGGEPT